MTDENAFLALWGKTKRCYATKQVDITSYHPLLFHLLDVAYCAWELWERLPAKIQEDIRSSLGLTQIEARSAFTLLAGLHDLGKACPPFQFQTSAGHLHKMVQTSGLNQDASASKPHGMVSAKEIARQLQAPNVLSWSADNDSAIILAAIAGAHHGVFPNAHDLEFGAGTLGGADWQDARDALAWALENILQKLPGFVSAFTTGQVVDKGITPLLAGMISIADWFGSSNPFEAGYPKVDAALDINAYAERSRQTASEVLQKSGWKLPVLPKIAIAFAEMFPFEPNSMQQQVIECVEKANGPYLLIVESAMGSGKTEAALYAADYALSTEQAHGSYLALPTQATSNAMHKRIKEYFDDQNKAGRFEAADINLLLVHANALLMKDYEKTVVTAEINEEDSKGKPLPEGEGRVIAQRWFTEQKKRALLAPFGVGTIDQALLSVLQTKHWFVRLFGLAGKVIIFDEIHAYDTYMSTILQRLLNWLAELDCTVILLSATLPQTKRMELLNAYRSGASVEIEAQAKQAAYPRLTFAGKNSGAPVELPVSSSETPKNVKIDFALFDAETVKKRLHTALPDGGCAAIICNTVDRAQEIYKAICDDETFGGWERLIFHARTPFCWRQNWEDVALQKFGKDAWENGAKAKGKPTRPERAVIVSTQVLEQSLNVCFDYMISNMAPADLLLQRMGRLHRFPEKDGTCRYTVAPCFTILSDGERRDAQDAKQIGPPPDFANVPDVVYDRYIVLRSWLALHSHLEEQKEETGLVDTLTLPAAIEPLVKAVYDDPEPAAPAVLWRKTLRDAQRTMKSNAESDEEKADTILVPEPMSPRDLRVRLQFDLKEDDDPKINVAFRAATRLSKPSVQIVCLGTAAEGKELPALTLSEPDREQTRQFSEFSLSIQSARLFCALRDTPSPTQWRENAHLRHSRAVTFDNGVATVGKYTVHLSEKLGIEIE